LEQALYPQKVIDRGDGGFQIAGKGFQDSLPSSVIIGKTKRTKMSHFHLVMNASAHRAADLFNGTKAGGKKEKKMTSLRCCLKSGFLVKVCVKNRASHRG